MKYILHRNNLTIAKVDKGKTMVIIDKNTLKQKFDTFRQENRVTRLNKNPTDFYQKQIQREIKKCDIVIDKRINKYIVNIKPTAPKLDALIKIHKENEPIRPVENNTQEPSYKIAKYQNKRLNNLINLPCTYTTKNSCEIAQELNSIQINNHNKMITLDIKDLCVNLPVQNILHITKFWLNKHNNSNMITEQTLYRLKVILKQLFLV
jgi:hypothetical protein